MFRMTGLIVVTLAVVVGVILSARSGSAAESVADKPFDLQQLSWMKGSWVREEGGRRMEEYWTDPAGKTMMGVARTVVGTRTVEFEFLRIVQTNSDTITYFASPGGRCPPTPFRLKQLVGERAVFENLDHDFPQRISYWRDSDLQLHARIEGESNGQPRQLEWSWPPQVSN